MKRISTFFSQEELAAATYKLASAGVLAHVQINSPPAGFRADVFVVFDAQLDDAKAVLRNPKHEVRVKLTHAMRNGMSPDFGLSTIAVWLGAALMFFLLLFGLLIYWVEH